MKLAREIGSIVKDDEAEFEKIVDPAYFIEPKINIIPNLSAFGSRID